MRGGVRATQGQCLWRASKCASEGRCALACAAEGGPRGAVYLPEVGGVIRASKGRAKLLALRAGWGAARDATAPVAAEGVAEAGHAIAVAAIGAEEAHVLRREHEAADRRNTVVKHASLLVDQRGGPAVGILLTPSHVSRGGSELLAAWQPAAIK